MLPLFRDVLDAPQLTLSRASNAETLPGYDSLAHIDIVTAIEKEFAITFRFDELVELQSVGDMIDLVDAKVSVPSVALA